MFNRSRSIATSILLPNFLLSLGAFVLIGLAATIVLNGAMKRALQEKLNSIQALFVTSVSQDILTGAESEVYLKCKMFFKDQNVYSIQISGMSGAAICNLQRDLPVSSSIAFDTPVFYDALGENRAGNVRVVYSTVSFRDIFLRSLGLLAFAACVLGFIQLFLSRKVTCSL